MNIRKTPIADVLLLEPKLFEDDRGFFFESYTLQIFEKTQAKILAELT